MQFPRQKHVQCMSGTCNFHARSTCSACQEHAISTLEARAVHVRNMLYCTLATRVNPRKEHLQLYKPVVCVLCNHMQVARAVSSQYRVLFLAMSMDISMPVARGISRQQKCTSTPTAHATYADTARNSTPILRAILRQQHLQCAMTQGYKSARIAYGLGEVQK